MLLNADTSSIISTQKSMKIIVPSKQRPSMTPMKIQGKNLFIFLKREQIENSNAVTKTNP
jgi:hypothetical protein